jgi:transposase
LILALADGFSYMQIKKTLQTTAPTISRWKRRFEQQGIEGLEPQHKGSKPRTATPTVQAKVCRKVQQKPDDGSTHWSVRKLAAAMGVSKSSVQRILTQARLQPHRLERYMASNDPRFEEKAADIIGLYLDPPQHAAIFCVDEKTAIQALDRLDPVLPLSPGRAERHGFEYYRHGTLSLRGTGREDGTSARENCETAYQRGVHRFSVRSGPAGPPSQGDSHCARQSLRAQDQSRGGIPRCQSQGSPPLHTNLFIMAESSGTLVRQNSTRLTGSRYLHLSDRPRS